MTVRELSLTLNFVIFTKRQNPPGEATTTTPNKINKVYVALCVICIQKTESNQNTHHFRKQSQSFQVLQDVTGFGCNEQHVELFHGLVDVSHRIRFDECVLLPSSHQLREGSEKTLDSGFCHLHELPRDDHWKNWSKCNVTSSFFW